MAKIYYCPSCGKIYDSLTGVSECLTNDINRQQEAEKNEKEYEADIILRQNNIKEVYEVLKEDIEEYNKIVKKYNNELGKNKYDNATATLAFEKENKEKDQSFYDIMYNFLMGR